MKCVMVGKSTGSFINRSTGELIDNSKMYVNCDFPKSLYGDTVVYGQRSVEIRVPMKDLENVEVGSTLIVSFDDKGKYESLDILSSPSSVKPNGSVENNKDKK